MKIASCILLEQIEQLVAPDTLESYVSTWKCREIMLSESRLIKQANHYFTDGNPRKFTRMLYSQQQSRSWQKAEMTK